MTKAKTAAAPKSNPMQAEVPPIDRTAETLEPVAKAAASPSLAEPEDVPMPTIENAPGSIFVPKGNIGTVDVLEIAIMYLLELSGSTLQVQPGALRSVPLSATRVAMLSDRAQAHMQQLAPPAPAPEPVADAPAQTAH